MSPAVQTMPNPRAHYSLLLLICEWEAQIDDDTDVAINSIDVL